VEELLKKLGFGFAKHIKKMGYSKHSNEKKRRDSHAAIKSLMDNITQDRSIVCWASQNVPGCPMVTVARQSFDPFSARAATSHAYTIVGTDGVVVKVLAYDVMKNIKIFVQHPNGDTSYEQHDSSWTMTVIEARARHPHSAEEIMFING
jgi:hypothetical protein